MARRCRVDIPKHKILDHDVLATREPRMMMHTHHSPNDSNRVSEHVLEEERRRRQNQSGRPIPTQQVSSHLKQKRGKRMRHVYTYIGSTLTSHHEIGTGEVREARCADTAPVRAVRAITAVKGGVSRWDTRCRAGADTHATR
jgi:hypothetical protein